MTALSSKEAAIEFYKNAMLALVNDHSKQDKSYDEFLNEIVQNHNNNFMRYLDSEIAKVPIQEREAKTNLIIHEIAEEAFKLVDQYFVY